MENYSYITVLTNDSYVYGVMLLKASMQRVGTKYPLHVLITDEVSAASCEIMRQIGVTYELVDLIKLPDHIMAHNMTYDKELATTWQNCWTKFHIFDLTQFDKIVFLDADIMILKNLDHLFNCPHMTSALDGEYFNLWPDWPHFNSGCLVLEPSHELYESILNFGLNYKEEDLPNYTVADQEMLNLYYKDWPNQKELHLNKYYDVFPPYVQETQLDELNENCYFVHYVGRKPWTFWIKAPNETYAEYYYTMGKDTVQELSNSLDWEAIRSKLVLSVYAICKNEIKSVANYVNSFSLADYLCILDTGSTDGTWEYLLEAQKTHPNLIIAQQEIKPWRFDVARNLSMTLIPKETTIYFMADLDEVIKETDWPQVVKNAWEPNFTRGKYLYNRDLTDTGEVLRAIHEYRIHSKEWHTWVNIVHEAITTTSGRKQFYIETCTPMDITVWHYPTKESLTNYMELCERDLEEYPDDWIMHLQLAIEYEIRGEEEKAFDKYLFLISHQTTLQDFEVGRCYFGVATYLLNHNRPLDALAHYLEGRLVAPGYADNYLAAAEYYFNNQEYRTTIALIEQALHHCDEAIWCSIYDPKNFYPYQLLGISYYNLGNKEKALTYLCMSLFKNYDQHIHESMIAISNEIENDYKKISQITHQQKGE